MQTLPGHRARTKLSVVAALVLLVLGCADDEPDHNPNGVYALEAPDGCIWTYSFRPGEKVYAFSQSCDLIAGGTGVEVEGGKYSIQGARIFFEPDRSTCQGRQLRARDVMFTVYDSGDLMIVNASSAQQYVKIPSENVGGAGASGNVLMLGCWEGDDFTANDGGQ